MPQLEAWAGGHHSLRPPARPTGAAWVRQPSTPIWWEHQPATRTAYIQYNVVSPGVAAVAGQVRLRLGDSDRIVVDVRHNSGGDNTTYGPLLTLLRSRRSTSPDVST